MRMLPLSLSSAHVTSGRQLIPQNAYIPNSSRPRHWISALLIKPRDYSVQGSSTHPEATAVLAPVILRRQAMLICRTCLHYKSNLDRAGAVLRLPSPFPLSTRMVLFHILRVTLVSALWFTSVSAHCTNPKVRKEWRNLCADERAAWINAVKVLLLFTWVLSALAQITPVSCQHAAQLKCRCDCRPGDFIDPAYDFKQFCLRR